MQYTAGCEGWNCITTDTIIFYSQNYSYLQLILPNGEVVDLNGYFKDGPDGMVRIEQAEYEERKARRIDKK